MGCRSYVTPAVLCLFILFSPLRALAEPIGSVDPEALEILKNMNGALLNQQVVSFRAIEDEEEVLENGQKILFSREIQFKMARPDKFHVQQTSAEDELEMFYDGSSFTLFKKGLNFFSTTAAPPTISEVFTELEHKRNIQVVAQDILRDDSYAFFSTLIKSGFVVGEDFIHGVLCTHLAFRLADTDMQIWVTKGGQALPKKYIVTSRWITGAPQYAVTFFDWTVPANIADEVFAFKAPQEAHEIPFLETTLQQEAN